MINSVDKASDIAYLMYPLLSTAVGILACILTSVVGIYITDVDAEAKIEKTLKIQIVLSTLLLTGGLTIAFAALPAEFKLGNELHYPWQAYLCSLAGLYAGCVIGWFT